MKLEEWEVVCYRCNGKTSTLLDKYGKRITCPKCYGEGKLDWIENVIGKRKPTRSILDDIADHLAEELEKDIDKQIMKEIMEGGYDPV